MTGRTIAELGGGDVVRRPPATALHRVGSWLSCGLEAGSVDQVGILHIADFDANHALAVQRDIETGALNLRVLEKSIL